MSDNMITSVLMVGLFLAILLLVEAGRRIGLTRMAEETERARAGLGTIEAAIYGLLALMVAFTFSGAASRLDTKRALVVQEANAIGTAYLRVDLLPATAQPALREQFRRYTETRLAVFRALPDIEAADAQAAKAVSLQKEIWAGAIAAAREAPQQASLLLLPALNEMIDITTTRAVALKTHTPPIIMGALIVLALFCSLLAGYGLASGKPFSMNLHRVGFALIMTLTIYVIFDLDHPRFGVIRVDFADQALEDVLSAMK
jgi:hypothetical protein